MMIEGRIRCAMMAAVLVSVAGGEEACAQSRGRLQVRTSIDPLEIVDSEAVKKELGLKPEEVEKVDQLIDDYFEARQNASEAVGIDFAALSGLTADERKKQLAKLRAALKQVSDQYHAKLTAILSKPQQARLQEIGLQIAGAGALSNPSIVKELGLTKEQQEALAGINRELGERAKALATREGRRPLVRDERQKRIEAMNKLRKEHEAKSIAVLTKAQQDQFARMKGKPFDTSLIGLRRARAN